MYYGMCDLNGKWLLLEGWDGCQSGQGNVIFSGLESWQIDQIYNALYSRPSDRASYTERVKKENLFLAEEGKGVPGMRTEIRHRGECGGLIGYFLGPKPVPGEMELFKASEFERIDGTHPIDLEVFSEVCPVCKKQLNGAIDMERMFQE